MGLPLGFIPYKITAKKDGSGECRQFCICPSPLAPIALDSITLAPYVVPTITIILIFIRPFVDTPWLFFNDVLIGLSLGYHTTSTFNELMKNWKTNDVLSCSGNMTRTDIGKVGVWYAAVYIPSVTLAIHGFCFAFYVKNYAGIIEWGNIVRHSAGESMRFLKNFWGV